ncbi:BlaI/MecI/CopY family transcriptional regulator [Streptomyces sp. NBC_01275]|uniref:BlaI/MecI/CopY family transcriptional regulator n=1 Tax=Streptomyces sp. NBC_01275 TaxID=2903807 RepID=UPI0022520A70|nr:BlaI/MecI/CopY family transcriptional regulator [Streptomyces sp. NBC_01275]MCX4765589.1 BlaI/MecI/CopY family transcriptional regulator [Streptomyces sp. NBC_01275]
MTDRRQDRPHDRPHDRLHDQRQDRRQRPRRRGQGELEALVLAALREADGPANAGWVQERMGGDLAYTTVITILTRLLAKGVVARERSGRSFAWTPVSDQAGLAAHRMRRLLDGEKDREAVLASFLTSLEPDDERLLRDLLDGTGAEGTGADQTGAD